MGVVVQLRQPVHLIWRIPLFELKRSKVGSNIALTAVVYKSVCEKTNEQERPHTDCFDEATCKECRERYMQLMYGRPGL